VVFPPSPYPHILVHSKEYKFYDLIPYNHAINRKHPNITNGTINGEIQPLTNPATILLPCSNAAVVLFSSADATDMNNVTTINATIPIFQNFMK
jgi:hypothetical protein